MDRLRATSYSATLDLAHLPTLSPWTILSTHRHACNLLAADGTLVALVSKTHGNGPFQIVIPTARFDMVNPAVSPSWTAGRLQLHPALTIDLQKAAPWQPTLPTLTKQPQPQQLQRIVALALARSALPNGPPPLTARAQAAIAVIRQNRAPLNRSSILVAVAELAGLGPGLTPAGDDFLVGFLAALWAGGAQDDRQVALEIAAAAVPRTTRLSGSWLQHAGAGHFAEPWHDLIAALNQQERNPLQQATQRLLNTGATSGADALYGFSVGNFSLTY
jgi:hypothetical protein